MRIAILLVAIAAALLLMFREQHLRMTTRRRLATLVAESPAQSSMTDRAPVSWLERYLPRTIQRDLHLLDIRPAGRDIVAAGSFCLFALALTAAFAGPLAAALTAAAIVGIAGAVFKFVATRRVNELGTLMPGFFDRVRQLLAIGNSLPTAFARAVQGGQPRLVQFFSPTLRRVANGAGFAESVRQSAEGIALYEMQLFAVAVSTNLRFGGSLTHALNNLVQFLRKRASIERELRASTALIRSSAWVLGLLPMLVAALIVSQNRDYARWFIADPLGQALLAYCIVSQCLGAAVMRAIIRTEF
jgi:tight adherence protein B